VVEAGLSLLELGWLNDAAKLIPWSSLGLQKVATQMIKNGPGDYVVKNKEEAEELYLYLFHGKGFTNTTGMNGKQVKEFFGSKNSTYHWDLTPTPGSKHGTPHLQIHDDSGQIFRIFFDS